MGRYFLAGTEINSNAYVAQPNRSVFGHDADSFRLKRWLTDQETLSRMDSYSMTFGKGTQTCMGKNIVLLKVNNLLLDLVMRFDLEFEDRGREWTVHNDSFGGAAGYQG